MTSGLFAGIQELVLVDDPEGERFSSPFRVCTYEGVGCIDVLELF